MADAATWYLVVELLSSTIPAANVSRGPSPLVGPITEQQCETTKAAINGLPSVIGASCRKAVGMMSMADPTAGAGYVRPIFEDELTVSVGSTR